MNRLITLTWLCALTLGCEAAPASSPTLLETPVAAPATAPTAKLSTQPASQPSTPAQQLDAMDTRKPVPLQPMMAWHQKQNMMEHLVAIERITSALAQDNWDEVVKASSMIASSPAMEHMCDHMGKGAPGFTDMALDFHRRADAIAPAAKSKDKDGVLKAVGHTLQACTSCHATWKQQVVDADTWNRRAAQ